nr:MAG TPA: hypothetical protein [Microviridae sp.]
MYTGGIGTADQIESAFARRRAKIPERNAPTRKSLRSIFSIRPYAGGGCISLKRRDGLLVLKDEYVILFTTNRITNSLKYTSAIINSITQLIGINIFLLLFGTPFIIISKSLIFRVFNVLKNVSVLRIP